MAKLAAGEAATSRSIQISFDIRCPSSWTTPCRLQAPACLQGQPAHAGETLYAGNKSYEAELEALIASRNAPLPELKDAPSVVRRRPHIHRLLGISRQNFLLRSSGLASRVRLCIRRPC